MSSSAKPSSPPAAQARRDYYPSELACWRTVSCWHGRLRLAPDRYHVYGGDYAQERQLSPMINQAEKPVARPGRLPVRGRRDALPTRWSLRAATISRRLQMGEAWRYNDGAYPGYPAATARRHHPSTKRSAATSLGRRSMCRLRSGKPRHDPDPRRKTRCGEQWCAWPAQIGAPDTASVRRRFDGEHLSNAAYIGATRLSQSMDDAVSHRRMGVAAFGVRIGAHGHSVSFRMVTAALDSAVSRFWQSIWGRHDEQAANGRSTALFGILASYSRSEP